MKTETYQLNKKLITAALSSIEEWQRWAEYVPSSGSVRILNLSLIRLVKGLVKAWRVFLSSSEQGQTQQ